MFNSICVVSYEKVIIGKNCQIASSILIADTNFYPIDPVERELQVSGLPLSLNSVPDKEIKIGGNVWIGWNSTILKGVTITDNCSVAAGSVVLSGDYPRNSIIAGNSAKGIKEI